MCKCDTVSGAAFVEVSQTMKVMTEKECVVTVYCSIFVFSIFIVTEKCGMCNTANCNLCRPRIVALYFLSTRFVSVQAETTCIFQMLYL